MKENDKCYETIAQLIDSGEYETALEQLHTVTGNGQTCDDTSAVLEAELYSRQGNREAMFHSIRRGLEYNAKNYELYYILGGYYLEQNPRQAFLCFENAEFYCEDEADLAVVREAKEQLLRSGVRVPGVSIVILSYNIKDKMPLCLDSIRNTTPETAREIIVVDNASTDGVTDYLRRQTDICLIENRENKGFPVGCNQGIKASDPWNDIFLLNNDTIVTPNAIFWLRMGLYETGATGAAGSVSNCVTNYQQIVERYKTVEEYISYGVRNNIPMEYPYEKRLRLIGFALMIKRTALDQIGLLDERFSPGNFEDDDISLRLLSAGYDLLLCKNSFVFHFGSQGFAKNPERYRELLRKNGEKFKEKWGLQLSYYSYERREVVALMKDSLRENMTILEIGCGLGATLGYIRNTFPSCHCQVYGIELDPTVARIAKSYIPTIEQGNIEELEPDFPEQFFDCIIFADVLEHLREPQKTLEKIRKYLKPSGMILASIPNLMHYSVILELLRGRFSYQDSGILDRTHLRFFTQNEILALFRNSGYEVQRVTATALQERLQKPDQLLYDALLKLPGIADSQQFQIYQYLVRAGL